MFEKDKISYTTKEAVKATGINRALLQLYREHGLLQAVKCGQSYVYPKWTLEEFMKNWVGYELKNANDIKLAKLKKGTSQWHKDAPTTRQS